MRVARSLEEAAAFEPVAVTIGNFDGVHTGHQLLLREVTSAAQQKGLQPAVLTFDPHPASIVSPQRAARLLTASRRCPGSRRTRRRGPAGRRPCRPSRSRP